MELELGLKITKAMDDLVSMSDFRIAKDRAGSVFLSRENDDMFVLTAHLKGLKRQNIDITINEDGTRMTVRGEKPVQEMVMIGWRVYKKRVELRGFRKVFKIPEGVVLDRIKAKFNEEESILTIVMPKLEKGIRGVGIEEMKDEEVEKEEGRSGAEHVVDNEIPPRDNVGVMVQEDHEGPEIKRTEETNPVVEKEMDRGVPEETKIVEEVPRKDTVVKESIGKGKPEKVQIVAAKEPEREEEMQEPESEIPEETKKVAETSEETPEIKRQRELKEAAAKDLERVPTTGHPEVTEQTKKQDIPEAEKAQGQEEENSKNDEFGQAKHEMPREPQKLDSHPDVQESTEPKPDQEPEQAETPQPKHPVEQHGEGRVAEQEQTECTGKEIQEANKERSPQVKEDKSPVEKQGEPGEGATQGKKPASKRCKLCSPCVVAGSAILVSLIVFVFHRIRAKKR
ncbi:hypothetical protein CJ030_MR3G003313 [Morella rubra]|uniref:SHSP domain-containing protein n=1 Tax=Morella rubra TaxID=262757 RepID=A0A6A1W7C7_9ROSI|nr:hypothetical protein CJ030_MR3G003313 [Morella rubra]